MKRVKTLGQLAAEFGDRLHLFGEGMVTVKDTGPSDVAVYINELGKPFIEDQDWSPSDIWRNTFLQNVPRRFKTAEELIASNYTEVTFRHNSIIVRVGVGHDSEAYRRYNSDTLDEVISPDWLDIFTIEKEDV